MRERAAADRGLTREPPRGARTMNLDVPHGAVPFQHGGTGALDAVTVARVIAAAADVAVVLDARGIVRDVAFGGRRDGQGGAGRLARARVGRHGGAR